MAGQRYGLICHAGPNDLATVVAGVYGLARATWFR